jgi:hypothetical protein
LRKILLLALFASSTMFAAEGIAKVYDDQVSTIEREVLGLAQKMPAEKYSFAPTNGTFTGVRTYAQEVSHLATMMYRIAAAVGGEKTPVDTGAGDNGPDTLKSKDQIIDYFQGAIAFSHKAMSSLTEKNLLDQVPSPFGRGTMVRAAAAAFMGLHTYDHYGQMVVYARMNGVVPGGGPPAPAKGPAPKQ